MRRQFVVLVVIGGLALAGAGAVTTATSASGTGVVGSITDGDTLRLADGRRVRLVQIDAPEVGSGECYSRASATALRRLLPVGSAVRLEADPRLDSVDRYGRLLRYVWRGATNSNVAIVRVGAAAPWFYGGVKGRYAKQLMTAAAAAKSAKIGLWKACPGTNLDPTKAISTRQGKLVVVAPAPPSTTPAPIANLPPVTTPAAQCADTLDNDGDGRTDFPNDAGCSSAADTDETDAPPPAPNCSASYPDFCIPPSPPDKDCGDFTQKNFTVRWDVPDPDPHRLDGDKDGRACES